MNIQKKKLLLIEDDEIDQMAFKRFANNNDFPYNFDISGSVKEAKEILKTKKYDIVVSDFFLGDGNAFDILKDLKDTPMVIATGVGDEGVAVKAMKLGAYDYLIKDINGKYLNLLPITVNNAIIRFEAEQKLKEYHENLEVLVDERTKELKLEIAERKQAEETLRSSEERLKILFESAPDAYYLSDLKGNFLDGNKAAEELIGYKREEIIGTNIFNLGLLSKNQLPNVTKAIANNLLGKKSGPDELILNHKDGRKISVEINTFPVKIKNKTVVIGIARDLTKRKQSEEALKESEEKYRNLVERANDGICIIQDGIVKFSNSRLSDLWGGKSEEVIDVPFTNFIHPDEQNKLSEYYNRRIKGEAVPSIYESVLLQKNGNIIQVELSAGIINYQGKSADLVIIRDIAERKQAEEELRKSEQQYRNLFDNATDAIYIQDMESRFLDVNQGAVDMYGYPKEFFIGKTPEFISAPGKNDLKKIAGFVEDAFNGKSQQYDFWGIRKNGEVFPKIVRSRNGIYMGKEVVVTSAIDITERKQAEKTLQESEEKFSKSFYEHPSAMQILNIETGERIDANNSYAKMLGYTIDEVSSGNLFKKNFAFDQDRLKELVSMIQKKKSISDEYFQMVKKSGEIVTTLASAAKLNIGDGNAIIVSYIDITEREIFLRKLEESENKLLQAQYIAKMGDFIWDIQTGKVLWSDGMHKLLKYKKDEIINYEKVNRDIHHPDDLERVTKWLMDSFASGKVELVQNEYRLICKDGEIIYVQANGIIEYKDNKAEKLFGTCLNITERKQTERENIKLSTAVTQSPSVIAITDLKGNLEYVNPKFTEITGYTSEEAKGKNPRILKSGEQPDKMYKKLWRTISSGKEWRGEFHNKKKNGELFWEAASVSPIFDKKGKIINYIKVAEDITERKQVEENLKKRMQELEIFNNATVNREMKIIELKKEINKLLKDIGDNPKYNIVT